MKWLQSKFCIYNMNALHVQVLLSLGGSFFQKHIFRGVLKGASAAIFVGQGAGMAGMLLLIFVIGMRAKCVIGSADRRGCCMMCGRKKTTWHECIYWKCASLFGTENVRRSCRRFFLQCFCIPSRQTTSDVVFDEFLMITYRHNCWGSWVAHLEMDGQRV